MARPIEPTPILEGEDAKKVLELMNSVTYSEEKQKFLDECRQVYRKTIKWWLVLDFSRVKAERLSKIYDVSKFDCGDEDLNDFIKNDAFIYQEKKIATTILFFYEENWICVHSCWFFEA